MTSTGFKSSRGDSGRHEVIQVVHTAVRPVDGGNAQVGMLQFAVIGMVPQALGAV